MENLKSFLNPISASESEEIVISKRFVDEKGAPIPFKIRPLTFAEMEEITRRSTRRPSKKGGEAETNQGEATRRMIVTATVYPDFADAELCAAYGTNDPIEVPGRMLLSGEVARLSKAISKLSGFDDDIEEEIKN